LILCARSKRKLLASTLLVAFAARALIPPGFMPAADRPFWIEICWDGLPAGTLAQGKAQHADSRGTDSMDMDSMDMDSASSESMPAHRHHSGSPSHSEHCVFGSACSAGPVTHSQLPTPISLIREAPAIPWASAASTVRLVHLPHARAPPTPPQLILIS